MGGCRCVYRDCQSSTSLSQGLHYFHFPVRDPPRCEQWIINARKPSFRALPKEKLRNKVVCSLHFEDKCFTNEKHDRLIHSAVPTLGSEDVDIVEDVKFCPGSMDNGNRQDSSFMLIPAHEDNTKYKLPDVGFSGMSYTIYDDALIPSSDVPMIRNSNDTDSHLKLSVVHKAVQEIRKSKRQKVTVKSINRIVAPVKIVKLEPAPLPCQQTTEPNIDFQTPNVVSYSVNTCDGDVTIEPSIKQDESSTEVDGDFNQCFQSNNQFVDENVDAPLLVNNVSLKFKSQNEYTMSVVAMPTNNEDALPINNVESDEISPTLCESPQNVEISGAEIIENDMQIVNEKVDVHQSREKEYINMIRNNSKQIKQLKRLVQKQNKMNKLVMQRKHLLRFKHRRLNKADILESLKECLKPSLMAILKLELLPGEEVVLSDNEEKFITDLYTENPECYNILLKKWNWNLPTSDNFNEENGNN